MTRANLRMLVLAGVLGLGGCATPPGPPVPAADGAASVSGPITLAPDGKTLWVVNPDADSVTAVDLATLTAQAPVPVGGEPWAVAVAPGGTVVVMNRRDGSLSLLEGGRRTDLAVGPEPGGLALSPSGRYAYVSVSSADEVAVVDLSSREVVRRIPVGRMPWAVAVTDDGDDHDDDETVVVTHRLARLRLGGVEGANDGKEGWLTLLGPDGSVREATLAPYAFGYANALEGLAVSGDEVLVTHLLDSPELPRDFETTVSAGLSTVSLAGGQEFADRRIHINEEAFSTPVNFPRAVALSPDGARAYLVLAGTDALMVADLAATGGPRLLGFLPAGRNPRGIVLDRAGERAYVMNYLSRDVSVVDLGAGGVGAELGRISVTVETLEPELLRGKILFNNANDPRLSHLGWISCASCHMGGGADGTTWMTPDGPRQTMPLWRLEGTAPFHISATRDEVQDFEHDIEGLMDGVGLAPAAARRELGEPNGGRSEDLDALAAYVLSGIRVPRSAARDGAAFEAGREVYERAGCAGCHGGPAWTASSLPGRVGELAPDGQVEVLPSLRDVGTYQAASDVLGVNGFDVPTLLGLHATAPYLHDGSAASLAEVLDNAAHMGRTLGAEEKTALAAFLGGIDASTEPPSP